MCLAFLFLNLDDKKASKLIKIVCTRRKVRGNLQVSKSCCPPPSQTCLCTAYKGLYNFCFDTFVFKLSEKLDLNRRYIFGGSCFGRYVVSFFVRETFYTPYIRASYINLILTNKGVVLKDIYCPRLIS